MKAITQTQITDSNGSLIVLIFDNDEERIRIATQLLNGFIPKDGKRAFAIYPKETITQGYVKKFVSKFI